MLWGNLQRWSSMVAGQTTGNAAESKICFIQRISADEREKRAVVKGKVDERDRSYGKAWLAKKELYEIYRDQKGGTLYQIKVHNSTEGNLHRDDHGSGEGYKTSYNRDQPVWNPSGLAYTITAPTWSPENALKLL